MPPRRTHHSRLQTQSAFCSSSRGTVSHLPELPQNSSALHSADPANVLDLVHTTNGAAASLRQLLTNPSATTLRAVHDRIRHQAAAPGATTNTHRASTSRSAAHAKVDPALARFYHLAQELIDDVASSNASAIYADQSFVTADEVSTSRNINNPLASPTYALYQHLPTGDYFTSAATGLSRADLKSLPKGSFRAWTFTYRRCIIIVFINFQAKLPS